MLSCEDGPRRFVSGALLIIGYGLDVDLNRGVSSITKAALCGHPIAQATLYRLSKACKVDLSSEVPVKQ